MPAAQIQPSQAKVWQKKIPTMLGLGFLVLALVVGVIFIGRGAGVFAPRASAETTPKNVKLTNVTDNSFTISFLTDEATTSFVKYGTEEKKTNLQVADDRVQLSATNAEYKLHHITVKGLQPGTVYYYVIGTSSGALFDNNGTPFRVTTAKKAGVPTAAKTIFGSVTTESGGPAEGSVVYIKTEGAGDLSSLVTNTGSWAVPLSNARTPDGSAYAKITDESVLALVVQGPLLSQTAQGSIAVAEAHPVPTISFGKGLAMASATPTPSPTPTATPEPTPTPTPEPSLDSPSDASAGSSLAGAMDASESAAASGSAMTEEVLSIDLEDDHSTPPVVTTQQPKISGKAAPNVQVKIEIHSDNQIYQEVTADGAGNFGVDLEALKATLEPGEHTVTYSYTDPLSGQEVTETVTFMVEPRSSGLIAQATPTPTPAYSVTKTPTPSPTPFGSDNPYPIGGATSSAQSSGSATTPTPTPMASGSATSTRSSQVSTTSGLPVSGAIGTTLALIFGGLFFIIAGTWSYWVSAEMARRS